MRVYQLCSSGVWVLEIHTIIHVPLLGSVAGGEHNWWIDIINNLSLSGPSG